MSSASHGLAACALVIAAACGPSDLSLEGGSWYTGDAGSTHTGRAKVDTSVVQRLVDAGADVELDDASGTTPLIQTARRRHVAMVGLLLEYGAKPCAADPRGRTLASVAADHAEMRRMTAEATAKCVQP